MELIPIPGAERYYGPHFFQPEDATSLFNTLLEQVRLGAAQGQHNRRQ